jgi:hypothetical protein
MSDKPSRAELLHEREVDAARESSREEARQEIAEFACDDVACACPCHRGQR